MDLKTFQTETRRLNKEYRALFGVIPCMQQFACSSEDYIEALKKAIATKTEIETLLPRAGKPLDPDALI